ncbi:HTH-type transcriptional regulator CynR [bioreactor metagenome]|uniref:HTH-type transcriptional regulator CynR n=1 Tax=bioreactor metagenome TaxID=1076179 RepID=A0A645C9J2_9ZZZZ
MNIGYLKFFYDVAKVKSISKVANSSHISQPALSQQIQKLEDNLGYKLLIRSNKGVELTEAGKIVERYAKNIIKVYDNMLEDLNAIIKNNSTIRIDACPTMATYALPCTLYMIKEKYPDCNYNLTSNFSDVVEQNVINDVCNVGFIQGLPNDEELAYSKVGTDRMVIVAGKDYYVKEDISMKELCKHPMILLMEQFKIRRELNGYFSNLGFDIDKQNILFNMDSVESIKSLLAKNLGISFLPYISIKKELYTKQLKEIHVVDFNLDYEVYIIYKHYKDMDRSVREFISFLKKIGEKSFC